MFRTLLCVSFLAAFCGVALADDTKGAQNDNKNDNKGDGKYMSGRVVRVDPTGNTITVRTGTGTDAKEQEFRVNNTTKFWGDDRKALSDGLRYKGFREGTQVWFRTGTTGDDRMTINDLRFYDPAGRGNGTGKDKDRDK
jgi:hypothetical protein